MEERSSSPSPCPSRPRAPVAVATPLVAGLWLAGLTAGGCGEETTSLGRDRAALCATAPAVDYCSELPALAADPVIDGTLDCGLALMPLPRESSWRRTMALPSELAVEIAVGWRPRGIYYFVHVTEPQRDPPVAGQPPYCGDVTHLFVDDDGRYPDAPRYSPTGTRQFLAVAPADAATSVASGRIDVYPNEVGVWSPARFRSFPKPDGYVLEAFITAEDLALPGWSLRAGGQVGVSVAVGIGDGLRTTVAGVDCPKLGDITWKVATTIVDEACWSAHCNTTAFCNPKLRE